MSLFGFQANAKKTQRVTTSKNTQEKKNRQSLMNTVYYPDFKLTVQGEMHFIRGHLEVFESIAENMYIHTCNPWADYEYFSIDSGCFTIQSTDASFHASLSTHVHEISMELDKGRIFPDFFVSSLW